MELLDNPTTLERMLLDRAKRVRTPANGSIELLPLCNMNCDMCYVRLSRREMEAQGRLRTAEEWLEVGRQMKEAGVLFLLLTGGEPFLYPEFRKVYLGLRQMGMILTINTNGTLIDEDLAAFFGKYKPRRVNITLYGADDGAYERLCHYPRRVREDPPGHPASAGAGGGCEGGGEALPRPTKRIWTGSWIWSRSWECRCGWTPTCCLQSGSGPFPTTRSPAWSRRQRPQPESMP